MTDNRSFTLYKSSFSRPGAVRATTRAGAVAQIQHSTAPLRSGVYGEIEPDISVRPYLSPPCRPKRPGFKKSLQTLLKTPAFSRALIAGQLFIPACRKAVFLMNNV